jgi:type I restriction enzyme M protein
VGAKIRADLMEKCNIHTILRLPTGIFYAQGVKANVLFFDARPAQEKPWTQKLWVYDLRTNMHFTLKQNPLREEHLRDFVTAFAPEDRDARQESERFRRFPYDELLARDKVSLDLTWLRNESLEDMENLPPPDVIAREIVEDLEAALAEFAAIAESLAPQEPADPSQ